MSHRDATKADIFCRLAKYRSTEKRESIENFLTELIAHLLREEPLVREAFARRLDQSYAKTILAEHISTQFPTRSRKAELNGLLLDLVIGANSPEIIVENKVDAPLAPRQLDTYLKYAEEKNARVAVIAKYSQQVARDCTHPRFLGQSYWSDLADDWSKLEGISNPYLLDGVLEFMRSLGMGAFENFSQDEVTAHHRWLSLDRKMRKIIQEMADKRKIDPFAFELSDLTFRPRFEGAGYVGVGWAAPADYGVGGCSFWYFLGFVYRPMDWCLPLSTEEPECVAMVGVWPPSEIEHFIQVARESCPILISKDFDVLRSDKRNAFFLARRQTLGLFLQAKDQRSAIVAFLAEAHREIKASGELPKLYQEYTAAMSGAKSAPNKEREP